MSQFLKLKICCPPLVRSYEVYFVFLHTPSFHQASFLLCVLRRAPIRYLNYKMACRNSRNILIFFCFLSLFFLLHIFTYSIQPDPVQGRNGCRRLYIEVQSRHERNVYFASHWLPCFTVFFFFAFPLYTYGSLFGQNVCRCSARIKLK